ncbi:MAG: branched-chain amino acid transaminase [Legionellales bacterium]|nr:branched-chain amino acid transaminase [Legionellales bacterium]
MSTSTANFADQDGVIWYDGRMVPWREANTHVLTHTLHYGCGVFEGIRLYDGAQGPAIFRLREHLIRLFHSAKIIDMQIPYDMETLEQACKQAVQQNQLINGYLRPMAFWGAENMGIHGEHLKTHVIVAAWDWGRVMGEEARTRGIKVKTSTIRRHDVNSLMVKAKVNGHYVNSILAMREAKNCQCDEALLLDQQGFVAEGSGENFFMVRDGVVYTPDRSTILEGITRDTVIQFCQEMSIPLVECHITRDQVYMADEAFFTGTAMEILPIRELDGRSIGEGQRGPLTEALQQRYFATVEGHLSEYHSWLTVV